MNLQLTSEQQMLRESAQRWVAERGRPAQPAQAGAGAGGERWREMADMGWLAMTLPERDGGLGQGIAEACVLAEALGAGPVAEPYLPAVLQAGGLLAAGGSDAQRARWLPALAAGEALIVPATIERGAGHRPELTATRAVREGGGWVIDGDKSIVACGQAAAAWIVAARTGEGVAFFIVERGTAGAGTRDFETVDGAGGCALQLRGVRVDEAARLPGADLAAFERVTDHALVAACAESVGAMDALVKATVDYTRQRIQFGRPLAANQVLRHRMAEMSIHAEEARSITLGAVLALVDAERSGDAHARSRAAAAARAKVGLGARRVAEEAIQLHGGMGVTEELSIGVYLRRQMALDAMFGPAEWHLRRHAELRRRPGNGSET